MGRLAKEERRSTGHVATSLEDAVNEMAADQAVLRVTLQSFLLRLFASRPDAGALGLAHLKDQVLRSVTRVPLNTALGTNDEHWKRQMTARVEQLFDEIEVAFGPDASAPPDSPH